MERMFVDPETGDIHPESYYHKQNIDLATVIETVKDGDSLGFILIPENVPRMKVRSNAVFELIKEFILSLAAKFSDTEDEDEREELREVGYMISLAMLKNLEQIKLEQQSNSIH